MDGPRDTVGRFSMAENFWAFTDFERFKKLATCIHRRILEIV